MKRGKKSVEKGYTHSFDMLGEAAKTNQDALTYFKSYEDYLKAENDYLNALSVTFTQYATILSRQ